MEGISGAEHHLGFRLTEGPQTEPIGQIGVQATQFPTLDPLTGEQQMDPDGTADAPDHEQMRHRGQVGTFPAQFPVVGD